MRIPKITGIIDRRILVNFIIEPDVLQSFLPPPFRPKIFKGWGVAGICLIRLKEVRPKGLPAFVGIGSENGAHRIAVEWEEGGILKDGVYIPRRDTSSTLNSLAGGRVFPGKHFKAKFDVKEDGDTYHIAFESADGTTISVDAKLADRLDDHSIFKDLSVASEFFKSGSLGYSPNGKKYDGLLLNTYEWSVKPLEVENVKSSFFENESIFPKGSVQFDNALLMTNIKHDWTSAPNKCIC